MLLCGTLSCFDGMSIVESLFFCCCCANLLCSQCLVVNALTSITMLTGSSVLHRPAYCPASFKHWISKHNLHGTFH